MPLPRICIDGFNLGLSKGSGIATYARNLNDSLRSLGHETQILYSAPRKASRSALLNEVALVDAPAPGKRFDPFRALQAWAPPGTRRAWPVTPSGEVLTRQLASRFPPAAMYWASPDIFHSANRAFATYRRFTSVHLGDDRATDVMHWTSTLPAHAPGLANIYTIHDLIPLKLPFATLDRKADFFALCREILKRADHVVTVSEHSKADICRIFDVDPSRITNTYQSVSLPRQIAERDEQEVAREVDGVFSLGWRSYFLFFGAVEPKKNLARVIEAYLASGVGSPLVIVGGKSWLDDDETRLIYEDVVSTMTLKAGILRRADRIRRYDYLPFSLLVSLIRGARATLFPSLYEGFGLPVLESMLLGTPVLTSTAGALPEVAGEAALCVDPYDTQAIAQGIRRLDADAALREDLAQRGRQRAQIFTPEKYQARLTDLYERLR